jgi:tripartite-type tricarboxylate transporter receptor subunit TctC
MPEGHTTPIASAKVVLERFDMSLGSGLGKLAGKVFRIGHLGDFNDLTLIGTLAGRRDGPRARGRAALVALARAHPGKFNYGSAGLGSGTHLAMELLLMSLHMDLIHVPFKGTGPALAALLGNQISVFFSTYASALPHVKADRLRAFAVTSAKRTTTLPQVPTVAENGVPGYEYSTWYGLLAPAKTPPAIIKTLSTATMKVLNTPEVRERYISQGMDPVPNTPAEFDKLIRSEMEKWRKVVEAAKIPLQ